jgi:hypothetical protein
VELGSDVVLLVLTSEVDGQVIRNREATHCGSCHSGMDNPVVARPRIIGQVVRIVSQ